MKKSLVLISLVVVAISLSAQTDSITADVSVKEKNLTYNFVPLPSYDPSTKFGISLANMFTFRLDSNDKVSPSSLVGVGAQFTTNGSVLVGGGGTFYVNEDKWRLTPQFIFGRIHQDLELGYTELTDARRKITVLNLQALRLVFNRIYIGLGYSYRGVKYEGRDGNSEQQLEERGLLGGEGNHGVKYFLTQDKRDNVIYPYNGYYAALRLEQYIEGSVATPYLAYYLDYRQFFSLSPKQGKHVFAYRFLVRMLGGDPQEQNFTYYGRTGGDIERGYETGSYIDKNMLNFEAEYRLRTKLLDERLGFVGFTGVGKVFGEYQTFNDADWLPMIGGGVRYEIQKEARINVRFDASVGKEGFMFYFGIREAF